MKLCTIVCLGLLLLSFVATTTSSHAQEESDKEVRPTPPRLDSMFLQPHDVFPENLMKLFPTTTNPSPKKLAPRNPLILFPDVSVSADTFPQNEPSVKISRKDPLNMVAAWRDFRTGVSPAVRRVGYSYSTDGGATWSISTLTPPFNATYPRTSDPAVGVDTAGNFYIATISITNTNGSGKIAIYKSIDQGINFFPISIAPADFNDQLFDDKEYITTDLNPSSPYANRLYISWTRFGSPGGMCMTSSSDEGGSWSTHTVFSDPGNSGQGSDPCIGPDGQVYVAWQGGPGIMFDKSLDGGASFGTDKLVDTIRGNFGGFPSIGADLTIGPRRGRIYVTFSDSRHGDLDVFVSSSSDSGTSWSTPVRVNDDPLANNKDQFWPWLAVDEQGTVTVVYYDTRNTPNNSITDTYLARSTDGGQTFSNTLLTFAQSPRNTPNGDVRYGDYIGLDSWGGRAVPVWTDERAGGFDMDIYTNVVDLYPPIGVNVKSGWNMVSLPLTVIDPQKTSVFPTATSHAFSWDGLYVQRDTLIKGRGYWLRFGSTTNVNFSGIATASESVDVAEGWNIVGSISSPIPVSSIVQSPPNTIVSPYYTYNNGYVTSSNINPGAGYWVKAGGAGKLTMNSTMTAGMLAQARRSTPIDPATFHEIPPSPPVNESSSQPAVPTSYVLEQNYPNPFNPSTEIHFALPVRGQVTITILNILGQDIETILNREMPVGSHQVGWTPNNLSSGVYFYRIQTGGFTETKKLLYMR